MTEPVLSFETILTDFNIGGDHGILPGIYTSRGRTRDAQRQQCQTSSEGMKSKHDFADEITVSRCHDNDVRSRLSDEETGTRQDEAVTVRPAFKATMGSNDLNVSRVHNPPGRLQFIAFPRIAGNARKKGVQFALPCSTVQDHCERSITERSPELPSATTQVLLIRDDQNMACVKRFQRTCLRGDGYATPTSRCTAGMYDRSGTQVRELP